MNVIRVTKTARNRVDVVFTGDKYLFFNPDNGLIALSTETRTRFGLIPRTTHGADKQEDDRRDHHGQ